MWKLVVLSLLFLAALGANAQRQGQAQSQKKTPRKAGTAKPECAQGAICFSGQIRKGEEFRMALNADLEFVLHLPGGFDVVSRQAENSCTLSLWIANPPLMAHHDTQIEAGYSWTAEDEVETSPREFTVVQNCRECQTLYDLVYDPSKYDSEMYLDNLKALKGHGRLWITDSKITHAQDSIDDRTGEIKLMKFSVEITLPQTN